MGYSYVRVLYPDCVERFQRFTEDSDKDDLAQDLLENLISNTMPSMMEDSDRFGSTNPPPIDPLYPPPDRPDDRSFTAFLQSQLTSLVDDSSLKQQNESSHSHFAFELPTCKAWFIVSAFHFDWHIKTWTRIRAPSYLGLAVALLQWYRNLNVSIFLWMIKPASQLAYISDPHPILSCRLCNNLLVSTFYLSVLMFPDFTLSFIWIVWCSLLVIVLLCKPCIFQCLDIAFFKTILHSSIVIESTCSLIFHKFITGCSTYTTFPFIINRHL